MSRHTIRAAVMNLGGYDTEDKASIILALEAAKVAHLAIVEEAGTIVALDDAAVTLVAWPAGVMIPEIGTLEESGHELYDQQRTLIGQQHNAIRQLSYIVRSLTRIVEAYTAATVYSTGGDDGTGT